MTRGTPPRSSRATIRPLAEKELACATAWAVSEGWNPGPADARVFAAADPGSLLAVEADGRPAGVISAVRMGAGVGFLGSFVLAPDYRKSNFAWTLWKAALDRLGDRVIGADGVLSRLPNYARYGLMPHYHTTSYTGLTPLRTVAWQKGLGLAHDTSLGELAAYDLASTGLPRAPFLREWLELPDSLSLVVKRDGRLCGLGMARRCHDGVRIGPWQADDPEVAEALFDALAGFAPGEPLSVDCPEINPAAVKLLLKKGLRPGEVTARLYRGEPPQHLPHRVFGQMSFALG